MDHLCTASIIHIMFDDAQKHLHQNSGCQNVNLWKDESG